VTKRNWQVLSYAPHDQLRSRSFVTEEQALSWAALWVGRQPRDAGTSAYVVNKDSTFDPMPAEHRIAWIGGALAKMTLPSAPAEARHRDAADAIDRALTGRERGASMPRWERLLPDDSALSLDVPTLLGPDGLPLAAGDGRYRALSQDLARLNDELALRVDAARTDVDRMTAARWARETLTASGFHVEPLPGLTEPSTEFPVELISVPPSRLLAVDTAVARLIPRLTANPDDLHLLTPTQFEMVVAELIRRDGYTVRLTSAGADGGVDVYAVRRDSLGSFLVLVQCKKYAPRHRVGIDVVRSLHSVLTTTPNANSGLIVTTSTFTKNAAEYRQVFGGRLMLQDIGSLKSWLTGTGRAGP
jgi:HJR/Mrr/RecB family endonuclease